MTIRTTVKRGVCRVHIELPVALKYPFLFHRVLKKFVESSPALLVVSGSQLTLQLLSTDLGHLLPNYAILTPISANTRTVTIYASRRYPSLLLTSISVSSVGKLIIYQAVEGRG